MKNKTQILLAGLLLTVLAAFKPSQAFAVKCANGVETSIIPCQFVEKGVGGIVQLVINILTAGVGVVAIGAVVYAGILYTTAGGSSEQTKKAIGMIINVVIGIIAYAAMYLLLNWIIPGGVKPLSI